MKKFYERPEMAVTLFDTEDIITVSAADPTPEPEPAPAALYDNLDNTPLGANASDKPYSPSDFKSAN